MRLRQPFKLPLAGAPNSSPSYPEDLLVATGSSFADFGLAAVKLPPQEGRRRDAFQPGTVHWMAPELIKDGTKAESTDIYALGVVLWELWAMVTPYNGQKVEEIAKFVRGGGRPTLPEKVNPARGEDGGFEAVMTLCWDEDAKKRPTAVHVGDELRSIHHVAAAAASAE